MDAVRGMINVFFPRFIKGEHTQQSKERAFFISHLGLKFRCKIKVEIHHNRVLFTAQVGHALPEFEVTVGTSHFMAQSREVIVAQVILEERQRGQFCIIEGLGCAIEHEARVGQAVGQHALDGAGHEHLGIGKHIEQFLVTRAIQGDPVRIPGHPLGISPIDVGVVVDFIHIVGDKHQFGSLDSGSDIECVAHLVLSAVLALVQHFPQACARVAGDGDGIHLDGAVKNGQHALNIVELGSIHLRVLDAELVEAWHCCLDGVALVVGLVAGNRKVAAAVNLTQPDALKIDLVVHPALFGVADIGQIARAVKRRPVVLFKYGFGIAEVSRLTHLDQTLISLLHARPSCRDHGTQLVLLARVAIDDTCIGLTLLVELHHPQILVPLVVDIHVAGELELGAFFQGIKMLNRVEFGDIGVDGVFGVGTGARVFTAGSHDDACHLGVLGAIVGKGHRSGVACPCPHSISGTVVAHISQQVKICGVGGIDGDSGDAALGHRQGNGAIHIDA